jgi:hypothetical protein
MVGHIREPGLVVPYWQGHRVGAGWREFTLAVGLIGIITSKSATHIRSQRDRFAL